MAPVEEKAPLIIAPMRMTPQTPEQAAEGHSTTTMEFPNAVHLTVTTNQTIFYPKGIHEVPDHLADHWYLKAHQARPYFRNMPMVQKPAPRARVAAIAKPAAQAKPAPPAKPAAPAVEESPANTAK